MTKRNKRPTPKELTLFLSEITKLEMVQFLGIAVLLKVKPVLFEEGEEGKGKPREAEDILSDLIDNFIEARADVRAKVMELAKKTNEALLEEKKKKED